jgi:hypothetical protein
MWTCSHCRESVPNTFAACWNCGTSHDGEIDAEFLHAEQVRKEELLPPARSEPPPPLPPWRWQFRLASVMILTTIVAFAFAIFTPEQLTVLGIGLPLMAVVWLALLLPIAGLVYIVAFVIGTLSDILLQPQSMSQQDDKSSTNDDA